MAVGCPDAPVEEPEEIIEKEEEEENNNNNNNNNNQTQFDAGPVVQGSIAGKVVNANGDALANLRVLACTASLCMSGETNATGEYLFENISVEPMKMEVTDPDDTYLSLLFYQMVYADQLSVLSRDVVMPAVTDEPSSLSEANGGTALVAGGALEITVGAGALDYPFGRDDDIIQAERLSGSQIPPYDIEPFLAHPDDSFMFALAPHGTKSSEAVTFKVTSGITQPEGAIYNVYGVTDKATLKASGTATVDSSGHLISDTGGSWMDLTGLVLVPDIEEEEIADAGMEEPMMDDAGAEMEDASDAGEVMDVTDAGVADMALTDGGN
ncbi:MAG: hypothetical protein CMH56_06355 [Myxococcales bacterium]|nr:hypothetical protein [Myxococcales bacterium]